MQETRVQSLHQEAPLEKEMAAHSSIIAWEIPWTEEPGRLESVGSQSRMRLHNGNNRFWCDQDPDKEGSLDAETQGDTMWRRKQRPNNTVMKIDIQASLWVPTLNLFGYVLRSWIITPYGNSMFNFLRNHQSVFCSACNILHSTSNAWGLRFQFLHILSSSYFLCVCVCVCVWC